MGLPVQTSRRLFMILSPRSLFYARCALESLFCNVAEPIHLQLVTDSAEDVENLTQAMESIAPAGGHRWEVVSKEQLDDVEASQFAHSPNLRAFRQGHPCWRKVTDPLLLSQPDDEMILLDPDLYFPNRFRFETTPESGLLLMWQRPNCLLPPEIVRAAFDAGVRLARHVDIGVSHWRRGSDFEWLDWMLGKLGAPDLPRMMHVEAIVWSAIAMREGGGYLHAAAWRCWHRSQGKRVRRLFGATGDSILQDESWSSMKVFHAGGEAKWWIPDYVAAHPSVGTRDLLAATPSSPFLELTRDRYEREQSGKHLLRRLGYYPPVSRKVLMKAPPIRILIAAENASTMQGGEAILPYHYFRLLRQRGIDAHLVVHSRSREELHLLLPAEAAHLHFVEDQMLQKLFYRCGKFLPHRIAEATFGLANQLLTQWAQRAVLRRLATPSTVVHQPIPVSPRFPSLLADVGAPVVIGPLNGGMEFPPAFRGHQSPLTRTIIALGRSLTDGVNAIFAGKRCAAIVLVANQRTRAALPSRLSGAIHVLPENAVDTAHWNPPSEPTPEVPGRFVFIGRLVDWKALDILFEALVQVPHASLDVVGDGPMQIVWSQLAVTLGIAGRVHFHGWRSQSECAVLLASSCGLVLPSLYECGGAVVLEAMAMSRPVVATAWGGPLDYLDGSCGILVAPESRSQLIQGFASAMHRISASPELRTSMGAAGREKLLRDFEWNRKIDQMLLIYRSALIQG